MKWFHGLLLGALSLGALPISASEQPARPAQKTVRGLVVLVQFKDVQHSVSRTHAEKRFFQELAGYVGEVSGGSVRLTGDVTKSWVALPRPIEDYRISPRNLEVDRSRIERLIRDSLDALDSSYDVSAYDFTALFLGARRPEYGMIGLCGYPGMLGWSDSSVLKTRNGRTVRGGVAIFSFQAHLGTLFHDTAHILGGVKDGKRGVPCLYDHDLQARPGPLRETFEDAVINMGFWDPMSCHYVKWESGPPGISSWTRLRLGWLDDHRVKVVGEGTSEEVLLTPLGSREDGIQVIRVPLSQTTYWLIENRQPRGFDANLPGSGVLIMKADDQVAECRHGKAPVKLIDADPSVPHLSGAAFDALRKRTFRDETAGIRVDILEKAGESFRVRVDRTKK